MSWNWPNWITVVLMVTLAYLVVSFGSQLVRGRMPGRPRATGDGSGQSQSQDNFAGIFGASEFAAPGAMTQVF